METAKLMKMGSGQDFFQIGIIRETGGQRIFKEVQENILWKREQQELKLTLLSRIPILLYTSSITAVEE